MVGPAPDCHAGNIFTLGDGFNLGGENYCLLLLCPILVVGPLYRGVAKLAYKNRLVRVLFGEPLKLRFPEVFALFEGGLGPAVSVP